MHRAPYAAGRSQVPCDVRPCKPVLCVVPEGRMRLSSSVSYAFHLPYLPLRSYLHLPMPSLTFLSHVTYCQSSVLPVLVL